MAMYRMVYTEIWTDSDFEEWSESEQHFFLFLITNPKSSQCGIYEISMKQLRDLLKKDNEAVLKLINTFEDEYGKIRYNKKTKEMAIRNWFKWNMSKSPTVITHVISGFKNVKDKSLIEFVRGAVAILSEYGELGILGQIESHTVPQELLAIKDFEDSWKDWLEYRKKVIKKPVSSIAAKSQFKSLLKYLKDYGDSPVDVIRKAIDKRWEGLFPMKGGTGGKKRPRKIVSKQFESKKSKLS